MNSPNPAVDDPHDAPSLVLLGTEPMRAIAEYAWTRLAPRPSAPPGDGHTVVIFPGLAANGASVAVLREHCRMLGYDAMDWGQGYSTGPEGDLEPWLEALALTIARLLAGRGKPATLIGWSLGGLYARELGKLLAPQLRQVITIGTPFNAGADSTHAGWVYHLLNRAPMAVDAQLLQRLAEPPPLPTTSVYSRSDGVVAWQSCCHNQPSAGV